jgi:hypothetical protein
MRNFSCRLVEDDEQKLRLKKVGRSSNKFENKDYYHTARSSHHYAFPNITDFK